MTGRDTLVAFDLDDTLYKERDYVASGFIAVAKYVSQKVGVDDPQTFINAMNVVDEEHPFDRLHMLTEGEVSVETMVSVYRNHMPDIQLPSVSCHCLEQLAKQGVTLAIITDGRHVGQWNKIASLGLEKYVDRNLILVSDDIGGDKYTETPWKRIEELTPWCKKRWYVGDNPRKDFLYPNKMGWQTVMLLDDGRNVKSQSVDLPGEYHAAHFIKSLDRLPDLVAEHNIM